MKTIQVSNLMLRLTKRDFCPYCIILQDDVCEFTAAVWALTGFHPMGVHGGKLNFPMCWSLRETTSHTPPETPSGVPL